VELQHVVHVERDVVEAHPLAAQQRGMPSIARDASALGVDSRARG
jgi:hypothetical protein